jgi:hypothetical protein
MGVGSGLDRPEMKVAILVGAETRSHREVTDLIELLHVIITVVVGVPDIDHGAGKRPAVDG